MKKVAIGAGHGLNTRGKRTPDGEHEWMFNNQIVEATIRRLNDYEGVTILRLDDPTGKRDVPLEERTNKANNWGADILVTVHHNAYDGNWGTHSGTETYTYIGSWPNAEKLAREVHDRVVKAYGLTDRGLKKDNFHMLRESIMPAILVEGGFMDSSIDIKQMRKEAVLQEVGYAVAEGIAAYFSLKKGNSRDIKKGDRVVLKLSASRYATGEVIPDYVKGKTYTVQQVKSDRFLLQEIYSWVEEQDVEIKSRSSSDYDDKWIRSKVDGLRFYNKPSWSDDDVAGYVQKGYGFPVVIQKLKVGNGYQYEVKNSKGSIYYITAHSKYVYLD
ncbi:N-acetylmuramoyl-L-alanine amidase family protein [Pontibacillus litoralis]|uniref:Cell wall hydrolase/autolysin n=1 Tax=Pontibacillus litoralis JSM 072002 TaxID=1385512 RepID=A0A0A5G4L6_9BACI|nr:N-acetylmuramoyl-L-alanine amidase [Pontibacillus litoralis]KGX86010.1 cell wall hydrolase/autolysin [Pontibacillus litoralis JSM 072002]